MRTSNWLTVVVGLIPSLIAVVFAYQAFGTIVLYIIGALLILAAVVGIPALVGYLKARAVKKVVGKGFSLLTVTGKKVEENPVKGKNNKRVLPVAVVIVVILFLVLAGPAIGLPEFLASVKNSVVTGWTKPAATQNVKVAEKPTVKVPAVTATKEKVSPYPEAGISLLALQVQRMFTSVDEATPEDFPSLSETLIKGTTEKFSDVALKDLKDVLASLKAGKEKDAATKAVDWWQALVDGDFDTANQLAAQVEETWPILSQETDTGKVDASPVLLTKLIVEKSASAVAEAKSTGEPKATEKPSTPKAGAPKATATPKPGVKYESAGAKPAETPMAEAQEVELLLNGKKVSYPSAYAWGLKYLIGLGFNPAEADEKATEALSDVVAMAQNGEYLPVEGKFYYKFPAATATAVKPPTATRISTYVPRATSTLVPVITPTKTPFNWKCGGLGCRATSTPVPVQAVCTVAPTATVLAVPTATRVQVPPTATFVPAVKPTSTVFDWKCGALGCKKTPTPITTPRQYGPTSTPFGW